MSIKPTGKSIAEFRERLVVGARIDCTENTRFPDLVGTVVRVVEPGKLVVKVERENGRVQDGNAVWRFPARVSDVLALTDDSITYRVGRFGDLVTRTILPSEEEVFDATEFEENSARELNDAYEEFGDAAEFAVSGDLTAIKRGRDRW